MESTLCALADANLVHAVREHARWQGCGELVERGGVLQVAGVNEFPMAFRNCVLRTDTAVPPAEVLARAREFFGRYKRGFTVILRGHCDEDFEAYIAREGLVPLRELPCMLVSQPVGATALPADLRIERIGAIEQVVDAVAVVAEAYTSLRLAAEEARQYFGRPEALLAGNISGFVCYQGREPVATALTLFDGAAAGVYWVGTIASARQRGLGEAMTRIATDEGFARGAPVVTLQASPFGEPIYRRMGYRSYDTVKYYLQAR